MIIGREFLHCHGYYVPINPITVSGGPVLLCHEIFVVVLDGGCILEGLLYLTNHNLFADV